MQLKHGVGQILGYNGPPELDSFDLVETDEEQDAASELASKEDNPVSNSKKHKIRKSKKTCAARDNHSAG